ncbi:MAG TPA: sigma-70 family RNA polymerase sigma factor [Streptosporangiaceae bacterium]|nr:sigma-70 family RNA polymerase sigma factor [Streptosporangiaceae bacterium]
MRPQADQPDGPDLDRLLAERGDQLMRAAVALAGSRADGEDLLQAALERLLRSRHRVETDLEGYLRRILYNLAADGWRRRAVGERRLRLIRSESSAADASPAPAVDLRDALVRLLAQLPPRQRTVIVLRFWAQLSAVETAQMLGCSEGAIKSAASRGLARLRELATQWREDANPPGRSPREADRQSLTGQLLEEPR